jgi:hypothetical protein
MILGRAGIALRLRHRAAARSSMRGAADIEDDARKDREAHHRHRDPLPGEQGHA